jgi:hypothetical protein
MKSKKNHRCEKTYDIVNKYFINDISNIIFLYFLPPINKKKNYKNITKYYSYSKNDYVMSILGVYESCEYIITPRPLMVGGILGDNPEIFNLGLKLINTQNYNKNNKNNKNKIIILCKKLILEYNRDVDYFSFKNILLDCEFKKKNVLSCDNIYMQYLK